MKWNPKRSNLIQRIAAVALAAVTAASIAGCGAGNTGESGKDGAKGNNTAKETKEVPKGRYVETAVPMPWEGGGTVLDLIRTQDGALELYSLEPEGEYTVKKAYRYDGTGWKEETQYAGRLFRREARFVTPYMGKMGRCM